ncbi:hypothetical protein ACFSLT_31145 [Novosphingobium resinovorum]
MLHNSGLTLTDGTTIDDLIDRDMNEVSLRVMNDKELYEVEMERIFARTWLLLGHETEIPKVATTSCATWPRTTSSSRAIAAAKSTSCLMCARIAG